MACAAARAGRVTARVTALRSQAGPLPCLNGMALAAEQPPQQGRRRLIGVTLGLPGVRPWPLAVSGRLRGRPAGPGLLSRQCRPRPGPGAAAWAKEASTGRPASRAELARALSSRVSTGGARLRPEDPRRREKTWRAGLPRDWAGFCHVGARRPRASHCVWAGCPGPRPPVWTTPRPCAAVMGTE